MFPSPTRLAPSRRALALLLAGTACALPAWAVNKCTLPDGTVAFQDTPCVANAKVQNVKTYGVGGSTSTGSAAKGATLCEQAWRSKHDWKDAESLRISDVVRKGFTTITLHDAPIVSVVYSANLNAKNEYGAYGGKQPALCYLDQTETRFFKIEI